MRHRRAQEIDEAVSALLAQGGSALFVTATGPHRRGDALEPLFDVACRFGELTFTGAKAKALRVRLGMLGLVRTVEVTDGVNGWHPHVHALLLFDRVLSTVEVDELRAFVFGRWQTVLARRSLGTLHPVHGLDVRPVVNVAGISEYVAMVEGGWSAGLEVTRSDLKRQGKGKTPFELLDAAAQGEVVGIARWSEYDETTLGRRAIQWTPGLRKKLVPEAVEVTDDEAAKAEGLDEVWLSVKVDSGPVWNVLVRSGAAAAWLTEFERVAAFALWVSDCVGSDEAFDVAVLDEWRTLEVAGA